MTPIKYFCSASQISLHKTWSAYIRRTNSTGARSPAKWPITRQLQCSSWTNFSKLGVNTSTGHKRYQRVQLPTLHAVMQCWDTYRQTHKLQWNDMWTDITAGCFNQLFWNTSTCLLMGFLLAANILMLMLICGIGVAVWSVLDRRCP